MFHRSDCGVFSQFRARVVGHGVASAICVGTDRFVYCDTILRLRCLATNEQMSSPLVVRTVLICHCEATFNTYAAFRD